MSRNRTQSRQAGNQVDPARIFDTIEFRDAYRMSYLTNAVVYPSYAAVRRDHGLVRPEYHLIMCLAHYPELTAQDIAKLTRMPRNTISRAVHRMVAEGYIARAPDPDDGRQAYLSITPAGRALHEKISEKLRQRQEEVLEPLSDGEREILDNLLEKLALHAAGLKT